MPDRPPLSTLLSQALVAFTIEFDNDAERQQAETGARRGFLTSQVMWSNFMRVVGADGVRVGDVPRLAGAPGTSVKKSWVHATVGGMTRWGYVVVDADVVRPTSRGRRAQEVWRPLAAMTEERWRARFGDDAITRLRAALDAVVGRFDVELPHYLPVVSYSDGMRAAVPHLGQPVPIRRAPVKDPTLDLAALLSQALLVLTLEFEEESSLSMAISANALRVLDEDGVRVRDLPGRSGVSKEAISASLTFLARRRFAVIEADPNASRGKVVRLTGKGCEARDASLPMLDRIEERWQERFGAAGINTLRDSLDAILDRPRFSEGLVPPPNGWRAKKPYATQTAAVLRDPRAALPQYPMVLHRGGWPDGS